jgi:hypothetical protein
MTDEPEKPWGSLPNDAQDPNYGRICIICSKPVRAGERYGHGHTKCAEPKPIELEVGQRWRHNDGTISVIRDIISGPKYVHVHFRQEGEVRGLTYSVTVGAFPHLHDDLIEPAPSDANQRLIELALQAWDVAEAERAIAGHASDRDRFEEELRKRIGKRGGA